MEYARYAFKSEVDVQSLVTCFYFELSKHFRYDGEQHDFWEMVYVDKGEVTAIADSGTYLLRQGDLLFHEPNEFHNLVCDGKIAPNVCIVTFVCHSEAMKFFTHRRVFRLGEYEHMLLTRLMREGLHFYAASALRGGTGRTPRGTPLVYPSNEHPLGEEPSHGSPTKFACGQLVKIYIETLLIHLIRSNGSKEDRAPAASTRTNRAHVLTEKISAYIAANLDKKRTVQQICAEFNIGRTQANLLFKETFGLGMIEYVSHLKIERSKVYIREEMYNFTEIAELLGYSSVHYFSRHFKKTVGMTPSEYSRTIKERLQVDHNLFQARG